MPARYGSAPFVLACVVMLGASVLPARAAIAQVPTCGDGVVDAGENCDDGNVGGGDCCSADCQTPDVRCGLGLDHYQCYQIKERVKTNKFQPVTVSLADQFETIDESLVKKPRFICNPVDKNGEGIADPTAHQVCYTNRDDRSAVGKFAKRTIEVSNQFGLQRLIVQRPNHVCLPAAKAIDPALPGAPPAALDHFRCYKAKPEPGTVIPEVEVTLEDQFNRRLYRTKKCVRFCNPVSKNGEPILNAAGHLMCYRLKDLGPLQDALYGGVAHGSAVDPGAVLTIDQGDGSGLLLADPVTPGGLSGLAFDSTGRLFGSTASGTGTASALVQIDPDTGALVATVGTISDGAIDLRIGDLAFEPGTDALFGIAQNAQLYTIDTTTALATLVGNPGLADNGGLAFASDGTLYLATTGFSTFELVTIDPTDASVQTTVVSDRGIDGLGIRGDGVLFATAAGATTQGGGKSDLIVTMALDGTTTVVGNTGAGAAADLDFRPDNPQPRVDVNTADQLGDLTLQARRKAAKMLCVPSTKTVLP
jgi:cysteine-rich repeat protein